MRVVNLHELCACPVGTIFSDFEPCVVTDLCRFDGAIYAKDSAEDAFDFFYTSLLPECENCPQSHCMDDYAPNLRIASGSGRWALYDPDAHWVVYDRQDIVHLVALLIGHDTDAPSLQRLTTEIDRLRGVG